MVVLSNTDDIIKGKKVTILNKNHQKLKLFKNITIGCLEEIQKYQENWV